ncbi:MAG: hypothetical protein LLF78_02260 [Synergistaceae bacterium]|nr:hypothetical protein [Synergistaceae bacterium]
MPGLRLIVASGTGQRRLLEETTAELGKNGYLLAARQEGGEWVSLLSDNMSAGLFDEKSLIVVDSAALMGVMPENLSPMVEADSAVIIILVYDSDPSKFIPKEVMKKCVVLRAAEFPRWPRERQMWVADLAREMKINIGHDAVAMIVEILDDPEEIRSQLSSLSMLKREDTITAADVEMMCLDDGSRSLLRLLDGLCAGDHSASVRNLHSISKDGDLIPLVSALHNRMRLAWYAALHPRLGAMFAKSLGARDYAWRMAGIAARKYGHEALGVFVIGLIKINIDEKSGTGAGWSGLEALIIDLVGKGKIKAV